MQLLPAVLVAALITSCHAATAGGGGGGGEQACAGVTCSGHGTCAWDGAAASCRCDGGFRPAGLACVPDSPPPPPPGGGFTDATQASGLGAITGQGDLSWCFDVTVEDVDGDGFEDVFIGDHYPHRRLALGDGHGRFTDQSLPAWDAQTWSQLAFDFDNDGLTDFAQNWDSADMGVLHNQGNRVFNVLPASASITTGTNGMAWGDWNGDGFPDYVLDGFRSTNHFYRGTGNGAFATVSDNYGLFSASDLLEATVMLADLTGDDLPDLLYQPLQGSVFESTGHRTVLARNTTAVRGGTASFSVEQGSGLDALPGPAVAVGDYDNDGSLDVFGFGPGAGSSTTVRYGLFHNDGSGHFTDVTAGSGLPTEGAPHGADFVYVSLYLQSAFLDYDGDGLLDLLVVEEDQNRLFRNLGGGRFQEVTAAVGIGRSWSGRPARFATGDLDGDRDVDFVTVGAVNSAGCLVQLWRNDVSPPNGLAVKLVGKAVRNALNSKLWLYEAQPGGGNGPIAGYREVLLSTSHRAPLEQYFALPGGRHYNLRVAFWPSGRIVDRADVAPGRLVIAEP